MSKRQRHGGFVAEIALGVVEPLDAIVNGEITQPCPSTEQLDRKLLVVTERIRNITDDLLAKQALDFIRAVSLNGQI